MLVGPPAYSEPSETHKHKELFSGSGVRRFTDGPRPQGHLPRQISDGFGLGFSVDPGSEEYSFISHSFLCLVGALHMGDRECTVHGLKVGLLRAGPMPRSLSFVGF